MVHPSLDTAHLIDSSKTVNQDECRAALREAERLRSRISWDELHVGDHICVKTDQGKIAQVTITDMSRAVAATIIIKFTTWS